MSLYFLNFYFKEERNKNITLEAEIQNAND